jgi:hypothetical protein
MCRDTLKNHGKSKKFMGIVESANPEIAYS